VAVENNGNFASQFDQDIKTKGFNVFSQDAFYDHWMDGEVADIVVELISIGFAVKHFEPVEQGECFFHEVSAFRCFVSGFVFDESVQEVI
jgi:hypothetical protein